MHQKSTGRYFFLNCTITGLTQVNPGIYLTVLFQQPSKKNSAFFTRLVKKSGPS